MSRVFNIRFPYNGNEFNALITVKGKEGGEPVSLRVEDGFILLYLPHGKLTFPIFEVVNYFSRLRQRREPEMVMPITETISLHLLTTNW